MLNEYLMSAITDLKSLIRITELDMSDIKEANHEPIFKRAGNRNELIESFENSKSNIDYEILQLKEKNPTKPLADLLDSEASELLEDMKTSLKNLKDTNANYARMVFAVSEFYTTLLNKLIPQESGGYEKRSANGNYTSTSSRANFLKLEV